MGKKASIDLADGLALVMSKDRPFRKREIADYFSCSLTAVRTFRDSAKADGHPIKSTLLGLWYMKKVDTLQKLSALATGQAWAAQQATAMRRLALEYEQDAGTAPRRLLIEYKKEQEIGE